MVAFQPSLSPMFWTSMAKSPHCPRFIVAGPDLVVTSTGAAIVIGGLTPHSPGSGA